MNEKSNLDLTPKVLRGQILAFAVLGMFLWYEDVSWFFGNFMVGRELEGLYVKVKNVRFGPFMKKLWWSEELFSFEGSVGRGDNHSCS
jgi:hypothetical protein